MLTHAGNRSAQVKAKVAKCLQQIVIKLGNKMTSFKENYKIVDQLATYLSDAGQEVRNNAKQAFNTLSQLCSKTEFEEMMTKSLNEQKYNKVKELMEHGFHSSMSEFSPNKQVPSRGGSNRSQRKNNINVGSPSKSHYNEGRKYTSSSIKREVENYSTNEGSAAKTRNIFNAQRNSNKSRSSNNINENYEKNGDRNSVASGNANNLRLYKASSGQADANFDFEDNKSMRSSPSKYTKRKISKRNIKKLDDVNVPRAPDFSKRNPLEPELVEESDIFSRLSNPDSKVSSKAADTLINNYEEYEKDVPENLGVIINSQAALF